MSDIPRINLPPSYLRINEVASEQQPLLRREDRPVGDPPSRQSQPNSGGNSSSQSQTPEQNNLNELMETLRQNQQEVVEQSYRQRHQLQRERNRQTSAAYIHGLEQTEQEILEDLIENREQAEENTLLYSQRIQQISREHISKLMQRKVDIRQQQQDELADEAVIEELIDETADKARSPILRRETRQLITQRQQDAKQDYIQAQQLPDELAEQAPAANASSLLDKAVNKLKKRLGNHQNSNLSAQEQMFLQPVFSDNLEQMAPRSNREDGIIRPNLSEVRESIKQGRQLESAQQESRYIPLEESHIVKFLTDQGIPPTYALIQTIKAASREQQDSSIYFMKGLELLLFAGANIDSDSLAFMSRQMHTFERYQRMVTLQKTLHFLMYKVAVAQNESQARPAVRGPVFEPLNEGDALLQQTFQVGAPNIPATARSGPLYQSMGLNQLSQLPLPTGSTDAAVEPELSQSPTQAEASPLASLEAALARVPQGLSGNQLQSLKHMWQQASPEAQQGFSQLVQMAEQLDIVPEVMPRFLNLVQTNATYLFSRLPALMALFGELNQQLNAMADPAGMLKPAAKSQLAQQLLLYLEHGEPVHYQALADELAGLKLPPATAVAWNARAQLPLTVQQALTQLSQQHPEATKGLNLLQQLLTQLDTDITWQKQFPAVLQQPASALAPRLQQLSHLLAPILEHLQLHPATLMTLGPSVQKNLTQALLQYLQTGDAKETLKQTALKLWQEPDMVRDPDMIIQERLKQAGLPPVEPALLRHIALLTAGNRDQIDAVALLLHGQFPVMPETIQVVQQYISRIPPQQRFQSISEILKYLSDDLVKLIGQQLRGGVAGAVTRPSLPAGENPAESLSRLLTAPAVSAWNYVQEDTEQFPLVQAALYQPANPRAWFAPLADGLRQLLAFVQYQSLSTGQSPLVGFLEKYLSLSQRHFQQLQQFFSPQQEGVGQWLQAVPQQLSVLEQGFEAELQQLEKEMYAQLGVAPAAEDHDQGWLGRVQNNVLAVLKWLQQTGGKGAANLVGLERQLMQQFNHLRRVLAGQSQLLADRGLFGSEAVMAEPMASPPFPSAAEWGGGPLTQDLVELQQYLQRFGLQVSDPLQLAHIRQQTGNSPEHLDAMMMLMQGNMPLLPAIIQRVAQYLKGIPAGERFKSTSEVLRFLSDELLELIDQESSPGLAGSRVGRTRSHTGEGAAGFSFDSSAGSSAQDDWQALVQQHFAATKADLHHKIGTALAQSSFLAQQGFRGLGQWLALSSGLSPQQQQQLLFHLSQLSVPELTSRLEHLQHILNPVLAQLQKTGTALTPAIQKEIFQAIFLLFKSPTHEKMLRKALAKIQPVGPQVSPERGDVVGTGALIPTGDPAVPKITQALLPLFIQGLNYPVEMLIQQRQDDEKQPGQRQDEVYLTVQTHTMGTCVIGLSLVGQKRLRIKLGVNNAKIQQFVQPYIDALQQQLSHLPWELDSVHCYVLPAEPPAANMMARQLYRRYHRQAIAAL